MKRPYGKSDEAGKVQPLRDANGGPLFDSFYANEIGQLYYVELAEAENKPFKAYFQLTQIPIAIEDSREEHLEFASNLTRVEIGERDLRMAKTMLERILKKEIKF